MTSEIDVRDLQAQVEEMRQRLDAAETLLEHTARIRRLDIPVSANPSQTARGRAIWDSVNNALVVGTGTGQVSLTEAEAGGGTVAPIGPTKWGTDVGAKFLAVFADATIDVAGNLNDLTDAGWVLTGTTIAPVAGSGDFLASADIGGGVFVGVADAGDGIYSPLVFGDYRHARAIQEVLGALPTKLIGRIFAQFVTVANDEENTAIGLFNGQGATSQEITIHSDGTNFRLRMEATTTEDAGAAVDTDWHLFEIHVSADSTEWFIDGVSQGTIAEDADDQWPMSVGASVLASTGANEINVAWFGVEYQ